MLTSGGNATGTDDSQYDTAFTTKTVIVGSDQAVLITSGKYLLFVEEDMTLAADDYLAICSCRGTDTLNPSSFVTTPYSDPTTIFVTPKPPVTVAAKLERSSSESYEDGELTVTIDKDPSVDGKTINYFFILQFQVVGQSGYSVERIQTDAPEAVPGIENQLALKARVDALDQYGIVDDTLFVAVQAERFNEDGTSASSDLSETRLATDDGVQQPPVNLSINYLYYEGDNGITNVTFNRPPSWALITPKKFNIYKEVTSESGRVSRLIGTTDFEPTQESYLFVDEHANQELNPSNLGNYWLDVNLKNNDIITYWATSVSEEENESNPSNTAEDIVSIPSSRPQILSAVASIENQDTPAPLYDGFTSLSLSFKSPARISGFTDNVYTPAYYLLEVTSSDGVINYTSTDNEWLLSDYPGEDKDYTFDLGSGLLPECSENAVLTIKLSAITSRELADGSPYVFGQIDEVNVRANSRPVITDINGHEGVNEFGRDSLRSFTVYSYSSLVVPGVSLLMEDANGNYVVEKGVEMEVGPPTEVPEGYYRFAGAMEYKYEVPSAYDNYKKILITAANASGFTQQPAKPQQI
jgi:hypothetical protein